MIGVTKRAFADLTSSKPVQDFQVEGGHWPSGLGIRKRLLLDPGGFPNLADPRTLLHGPLQKWLVRCMTRVSLCRVVPSKFKANDTTRLELDSRRTRYRVDIRARYRQRLVFG
ncbi:hypothetical protein ALC56_10175 [Trachymyrmex septentrionalis]|uniref:Uncharacterized protein n=1 Tax=Trachymyrmex septentrionalis TaxID=34720 RepID=A0A195F4V4_9HYME|nr:hypothetical protein ALC56_10175 [Trachymyrmex septentrionalis]